MGFIKKHAVPLAALSLVVLYFSTRLYNILALPIFTDEAIYIRWSQIALNDPAWRFISLTDGKQPLFVWFAMIFLKFIEDPLLAGRLVSVFAGFFTMIGLFFLTYEVFKNKTTAFLASFIYVLFPFALVYDRVALYDSLVAMFIVWALYFEILLIRHIRLDLAIILGVIIGAGMLNKTSVAFALILLPFSLLLFDFKAKKRKKMLLTWVAYSLVAVIISQAIYLILRLSPFFYIIDQKNHVFIYTFQEWIRNPFVSIFGNLSAFEGWIVDYATIPFLILVVAAFLLRTGHSREKALIYLWFLVPLISTAFFGKLVYPRFLFFMIVPLIALGAHTLYFLIMHAKQIWMKAVVVLIFTVMFLISDYFIFTDFKNAPIPQSDKGQFVTGWPSGVGVKESVEFLKEKAKDQKIYVGTQGTFGLMPYSLEIYFAKNPNVEIEGFWPTGQNIPDKVLAKARDMPAFFVFYQLCDNCPAIGEAPLAWPVRKVFQIEKDEPGQFYTLYEVLEK